MAIDRSAFPKTPDLPPRCEKEGGDGNCAACREIRNENDVLRAALAAAQARIVDIEQLADRDPLLNILNRRAFMRELARFQSTADRHEIETGVILFDLDNFKALNDTYGHAVGDAALRHLSEIIRNNIRDADRLGRLGGDEFAVALFNQQSGAQEQRALALRQLIVDAPFMSDRGEISLDVSVGSAALKKGGTVVAALDAADTAMYAHKKQKKAERA